MARRSEPLRLFLLLYKEKVRMRLAFEQKFFRELQTMRSGVSRPFGNLTQDAKGAKVGGQGRYPGTHPVCAGSISRQFASTDQRVLSNDTHHSVSAPFNDDKGNGMKRWNRGSQSASQTRYPVSYAFRRTSSREIDAAKAG
jgi:hypothetical protein